MPERNWYPYGPDQAFGHEAALDEELVDTILARLDLQRRAVPRAGNKAQPTASDATTGSVWQPTRHQLELIATQGEEPTTVAAALEAATLVRGVSDV